MRIEINEVIATWEQIGELPEGHQTHPPEDPETRTRLAEVVGRERALLANMRALVGLRQSADIAHLQSFEQVKELVKSRGGRPKGKKRRNLAERINTHKDKSIANIPQGVIQNYTVGDTAVRVFGLIKGLEVKKGYSWASQPAMARMIWGEKNYTNHKRTKVRKALKELERAGYIVCLHKSEGNGDTDHWATQI